MLSRFFKLVCFLTVGLGSLWVRADGFDLVTSFGRQNVPPQVYLNENGEPERGILVDVTQAIAKQLDADLRLLAIPRKRIEQFLLSGAVEFQCVASPRWYPNPKFKWSPQLYTNPDILISRTEVESIESLAALTDIKVGTVLGFVYPRLEPMFNQKKLIRMDSTTLAGSQKRFLYGELDAFVTNQLSLLTQFKIPNKFHQLQINPNPIHCVYSPLLSDSKIAAINKAINILLQQGTFEAIVKKYLI